ncbi:ribonuclease HIII [Allobacillus sp. GCM10007491]|uniref:Ribonuclease HIII n=1 Tax=Allobacillus saliphilus TaxID=2912308 RepID=A0A941HTV3_9BACI|nr:ribonuclease HIII [Allobacillus saliphilus]MBR7554230.1 ribonuclease HIII [Allobacillus saliphilus]
MAHAVVKVNQSIIQQMQNTYQSNILPKTPPHAHFSAKVNGCTITAYQSGKVVFQGNEAEKEASRWGKAETNDKKKKNKTNRSLPAFLNDSHMGSDEAGTGDYFGPITVACVFATKKQQELLRELGVRDSKTLSDDTIRSVMKDVLLTDIVFSSVVLDNPRYNQLKSKGWSQVKMKAWMHHHAIQNVRKKLGNSSFEGTVVDQFCEPSTFHKAVRETGEQSFDDLTFMTKAESYSTPVAAASMLARYRFLQEIDRISEKVGFSIQKGASNIVDKQIARLIKQKGTGYLDQIAKTHFANTQKGKKLL